MNIFSNMASYLETLSLQARLVVGFFTSFTPAGMYASIHSIEPTVDIWTKIFVMFSAMFGLCMTITIIAVTIRREIRETRAGKLAAKEVIRADAEIARGVLRADAETTKTALRKDAKDRKDS